jgi:hypothetical protein
MDSKTPYLLGGEDLEGIDCSGLINFVYRRHIVTGLDDFTAADYVLDGDGYEELVHPAVDVASRLTDGEVSEDIIPYPHSEKLRIHTVGVSDSAWAALDAGEKALFSVQDFHVMLEIVYHKYKRVGSTYATSSMFWHASNYDETGVGRIPARYHAVDLEFYEGPFSYITALQGLPASLLSSGWADLTKFKVQSFPTRFHHSVTI